MSQIFLIIIVIVVLYVMGTMFEWISDHKEVVFGFLGVIAFIFILPKIWPVISGIWQFIFSGFQLALSNWPILLIVLISIGAYQIAKRKRAQEFVLWIDRVGIAKKSELSVKQGIIDFAEKKRAITVLESGQILSMGFYNQVLHGLDQPLVVSKELFQNSCRQFAPDFQSDYTVILTNYISSEGKILPISGTDDVYLSNSLKDTYIELFKKQGAATESEFADTCKAFDTGSTIIPDPQAIAATILSYMHSKGVIDRVPLQEIGETLFVSKMTNRGSNLVRKEIKLDD